MKNTVFKLSFSFFFLALMLTAPVHAKLAGKNLLLVQGFELYQLIENPTDNGQVDGIGYWDEFLPATKDPASARILYWPSHLRLQGADGVAAIVSEQLRGMLASGFCDEQCIVVTHSSGDLVMRYVMANKLSLLGPELAERFKVAAFIDMAGAGGGTELVSVVLDVIHGMNQSPTLVEIIKFIAGVDLSLATTTGILPDLTPNAARNMGMNSAEAIPHLRVASTGKEDYYGIFLDPFIKGGDDSVIPLHSSCGAAVVESFYSCTADVNMDGQLGGGDKAPSRAQMHDYYYPIILSDEMAHTNMTDIEGGNAMTFALEGIDLYEQEQQANGQVLPLLPEYEEVTFWWDWFNEYRRIVGAEGKSLGQVLDETFSL